MRRRHLTALAVALTVLWPAAAEGEPISMGKPRSFPHAGVALAVPEGFRYRSLGGPFDVMHADAAGENGATQSVSLAVYPVGENVSAKDFAAARTADLKKSKGVDNLSVVSEVALAVAGTTGWACTVEYSRDNLRVGEARVCFIRELTAPNRRLCCALTVRFTLPPKGDPLQGLEILGGVIKTLRLTDLQSPLDSPALELGEPVVNQEAGFSVRPPLGWYYAPLGSGAELRFTDYSGGAWRVPTVRIVAEGVAEAATCKALADERLALATKGLGACEVSRGLTKLASLEAHHFMARQVVGAPQTAPVGAGPANSQGARAMLQTIVCTPPRAKRSAMAYSIVVTCQGGKGEKLQALMEKVSTGFELLDMPKSPPATATAPTATAATAPATRPRENHATAPSAGKE